METSANRDSSENIHPSIHPSSIMPLGVSHTHAHTRVSSIRQHLGHWSEYGVATATAGVEAAAVL